MWPLTGGCHYSLGCKKYYKECSSCPNLKSFNPFKDQIKKIFNIKRDILSNLKLNLVPISKWLENEINQSKILKDQSVTQIYNCVDNNIFYPSNYLKDRNELNLPKDKFIILVGSQKLNDKIKNKKEILNLVNKFNKDYEIIGDFDLFFRLSQKFKIGCIQKPLAYYGIHDDNFSKKKGIYIKELSSWLNKNQKKLKNQNYNLSQINFLILKLKVKNLVKRLFNLNLGV